MALCCSCHGFFVFLFFDREINMGAQGIIEMEGKKTKIYNIKVTFDVKLSPFRLYLECA